MKSNSKKFSPAYVLFLIPFVLAYASWANFPVVAKWTIANAFDYSASEQAASLLWLGLIGFFYTWYTFLAIGAAGVWIVAAFLARRKPAQARYEFYPMVSFVVPAFNEEKNVARCVVSLYKCAEAYSGNCEVIIVDDGSTDLTFETAQQSAADCRNDGKCRVRWKIVRHMTNLGKTDALRTGVNVALGQIIAVVDADSDWLPDTLTRLVDAISAFEQEAVTGYIHPKADGQGSSLLVSLQQLEYSQGLGIDRCAQSLGSHVLVVPGVIGVYDADLLRKILTEANIRSVTEDSEITLEMQKRGGRVGYASTACSGTDAPRTLKALWNQRLRWFTGWLHNILDIHADLFRTVSWLSALMWYSLVFEFVGTFVDLAAVVTFPFLFWFAPDRMSFALNLVVFAAYGLLLGIVNQAVALRFAYSGNRHFKLLLFTPFYFVLWFVNVFARFRSILAYVSGSNGKWH